MKLFVYGTLKRGKSAHSLMKHCEFLGETILPGYSLYRQGGLPVLVIDHVNTVTGEVYRIPEYDESPTDPHHGGKVSVVGILDQYEGYISKDNPSNLYNRVKAYTVDQEMVDVYVYNGQPSDEAEFLIDGVW